MEDSKTIMLYYEFSTKLHQNVVIHCKQILDTRRTSIIAIESTISVFNNKWFYKYFSLDLLKSVMFCRNNITEAKDSVILFKG
jgi:hypothetical protein